MAGGRPSTGKITISRRITPSLVPILDAFIKMLEENNGMVVFQPGVVDQVPQEVKIEKPIQRFGISPNDFLKSIGKGCLVMEDSGSDLDKTKGFAETINHRTHPDAPSINITSKLHEEEKDYTAWQDDDRMIEVDKAINCNLCGWSTEGSQVPPDLGYEILTKHQSLATKLQTAYKNGNNDKYNELMTELYERIKDE